MKPLNEFNIGEHCSNFPTKIIKNQQQPLILFSIHGVLYFIYSLGLRAAFHTAEVMHLPSVISLFCSIGKKHRQESLLFVCLVSSFEYKLQYTS